MICVRYFPSLPITTPGVEPMQRYLALQIPQSKTPDVYSSATIQNTLWSVKKYMAFLSSTTFRSPSSKKWMAKRTHKGICNTRKPAPPLFFFCMLHAATPELNQPFPALRTTRTSRTTSRLKSQNEESKQNWKKIHSIFFPPSTFLLVGKKSSSSWKAPIVNHVVARWVTHLVDRERAQFRSATIGSGECIMPMLKYRQNRRLASSTCTYT